MGAGAVILAAHHEQDMQQMGGLRKKLKGTYWVMVMAVLAISGFPGFSGFFSKDEILTSVHGSHQLPAHGAVFWIGVVTAGFTAFYMFRLLFLTFHGKMRLPRAMRGHLEDPGDLMMWPLYVLAALSVLGGIVGMPQFWGNMMQIEGSDSLGNFLASVVTLRPLHEAAPATEWELLGITLAFSGAGFAVALVAYVLRPELGDRARRVLALPARVLARRFYVDEIYDTVVVRPLVFVSDRVLFRGVDAGLIDRGLVEGTARAVRGLTSGGLRYVQSGLTQAYLLLVVAGTVAVLAYLIG
jgi:NADH-quinone oxidoreductase subunit L